jgi:type IV secretion system protein VirB8
MAKSIEQEYTQLALGWETDRIVRANRSERRAWWIAGIAVIAAAASSFAIVGLTPLKEKQIEIVRVNDTTGRVDVVTHLSDAKEEYGEAVNKYFVANYIRAHESFSQALAAPNYETVGLMSSSPVAQRFHESFKPENPESPLKRFVGAGDGVEVRILNVSFITPLVASVRYERTERLAARATTTLWTATVTFKYSRASLKESNRLINPLGFLVTDYRVDPEVVGG